MRVSFLDGPSLAEKFPELTASCTQMDIAMAYVKMGGLRTLLKSVKRGTPIRIVFGLSSRQGITDKESAERLLKLSKRKNVVVKKFNNSGFHPKLFIFQGGYPCIVVGSANLTEAAQSTNAEANILVEDADSQLLRDTLSFFEHYFNAAPILKRKDVITYKPKKKRPTRGSGVRLREDDLPSPLRRRYELESIRPNKIWKIAPGEDARYWSEWLDLIDDDGEGIVAIGWDLVGDLDDFKFYDSLKRAVAQTAREVWDKESDRKTNVKYATDQLWSFKTEISQGDVFIVYSEVRVLGIAQVTAKSKYQYWGTDRGISYGNQINVKYIWYKEWPRRADSKIVRTLGKRGTLRLVEEDWVWDYLIKNLS